jgi:hypothetical protein
MPNMRLKRVWINPLIHTCDRESTMNYANFDQFAKKDSMANVGSKHREHITLNIYISAQNILP